MRRPHFALGLVLVVAVAALPGCRLPGGESPPTRYWVLDVVDGAPAKTEMRVLVGVGPFEFPAYLERSEMVRRLGASELRVSQLENWGQNLDRNFRQTLARNLEILVPGSAAAVFPWKGPVDVHVRVAGVVSRFEVQDGRTARLEASWAVRRVADGHILGRGAWAGEEPVDGHGTAAEVAALSRALGALSQEISKPLRQAGSAETP
jgi:uncharacterized lipoprotein YmbA